MASNARGTNSSPNIYTREIDLSYYTPKSLGVTTLGLVGETTIGPAFQPIPISSYNEFVTYFGGLNPEKYSSGYPRYELPYIAKAYLQQSQQLYVTRVLGLSGYKHGGLWGLYTVGTGTDVTANTLFGVLRSKGSYEGETLVYDVTGVTITSPTSITGSSVDFDIVAALNGGGSETYSVSLSPAKKNYIVNVLGNNLASSSNSKIYVEEFYDSVVTNLTSGTGFNNGCTVNVTGHTTGYNDYTVAFSYAKTPWFVSEVKGSKVIPLFRFYTITDGNGSNSLFKVSIANADKNSLKFDVILRDINDTDTNPVILERYVNCVLDPNSPDYIGAKIGTVDGIYELRSKYIMIEINDSTDVIDSVPLGFTGYQFKNVTNLVVPKVNYNKVYTDTGTSASKKPYFGLSNTTGVDSSLFQYKGNENITLTKGFHMESAATGITINVTTDLSCTFDTLGAAYEATVFADKKLVKFTANFSGGFDGWDIFRTTRTNTDDYQYNTFSTANPLEVGTYEEDKQFSTFVGSALEKDANFNGIPNIPVSVGMTSDLYAFWSAIRTLANADEIEINVLATPGIDLINNSILVSETIEMIETERKDCLYIATLPDKPITETSDAKSVMYTTDQIIEALDEKSYDSSYTATSYPWVQYKDPENGISIYLPQTKDVVKSIAYTDNTAYAWFPPAGMGRGNIDCIKAKKALVLSEENDLYDARINFAKTFAKDGVKIWGQKTLQVADTALNRIGTRRMMLELRKSVRRGNLPLIFEPNDNTTKNSFLEIVNPILNSVKTNRGISDFRVVIDDSAEAKARHEMNVQIFVKPIGALEYINIDFIITPEGFDFNQI